MAKRSAESLSMVGDSAKIPRIENKITETVKDKKSWRINNKECYRIIACHDNKVLDRSVLNKKLYDEINVDCTYKFTYQKINELFYIVDYQLMESTVFDEIKNCVTYNDFEFEQQIRLYIFIVCAYEFREYTNNNFSTIKVCTVVKREDEFVQCDLLITLNTLTTFDIEQNDDNATRVTKALKRLYQLKDKWCVAQVGCIKSIVQSTAYYKLVLLPNTDITELEPEEEVHADKIGEEFSSISYKNKVFRCVEVSQLTYSLTDFLHRASNTVKKLFKISLTTTKLEKIDATAFMNNMKQEQCEEGLLAVNKIVANKELVYAILTKKHEDKANYCMTSVVTYSKSKNDFYSLFC